MAIRIEWKPQGPVGDVIREDASRNWISPRNSSGARAEHAAIRSDQAIDSDFVVKRIRLHDFVAWEIRLDNSDRLVEQGAVERVLGTMNFASPCW